MPKKGAYEIVTIAPPVPGIRRGQRVHVMFDPAASSSRRGITDSGRRFEIELTIDGHVRFHGGDRQWQEIAPEDPPNGPPVMLSFDRVRSGENLGRVRFEMIAVGRGRILAKEEGEARYFHVVLNDLFKTLPDPGRRRDKAVPGNYFKLDPEFFTTTGTSPAFPAELNDSYNNHPASLRFPLFRLLLASQLLDATVVIQNPREWHLIDARSPINILGPEDLKFTAPDLRNALDQARITRILQEFYAVKLAVVSSLVEQTFRRLFDRIVSDSGLGSIATPFRQLLQNSVFAPFLIAFDFLTGLVSAAAIFFRDWVAVNLVAVIRGNLIHRVADYIIVNHAARELHRQVRLGGVGGLVFPAGVALLTALLERQDQSRPGGPAVVPASGTLRFHPKRLLDALANGPSSPELEGAFETMKTLSRLRALRAAGFLTTANVPTWAATPNPPPPALGIRRELFYRSVSGGPQQSRFGIDYSKVIDLGVGYSHWSEQHQLQYGGEIHAVLSNRDFAQDEGYNSVLYRFLNGPIKDGDAFIDGTTNFYLFVKLRRKSAGFAVLWIDEQTYFTQRWRLVHPTADVLGDSLSLPRTLQDTPERFDFDLAKFWEPFADGSISERSRMVVKRQIIVLTGFEPALGRYEIYTLCFNYGMCDHTWRWRLYPPGATPRHSDDPPPVRGGPPRRPASSVTVDSIDLREDGNVVVAGELFDPSVDPLAATPGRFFQTYLPSDCRHVPDKLALQAGAKPASGFDHPWDFFSDEAYRFADEFYQLGIYERLTDSRCQYYEIDLLPDARGRLPDLNWVTTATWTNKATPGAKPLFFNTLNVNFPGLGDGDSFVSASALLEHRRGKETLSMYEPTTRLRLRKREPLGIIATFEDKRDDELQPASHLPQKITLREEGAGGLTRGSIQVIVRRNVRINHPPIVKRVVIGPLGGQPGAEVLPISFWTPQGEDDVNRNIWRVVLAAFLPSGRVDLLLTTLRHTSFARSMQPTQPLPHGFVGNLGDDYRYHYDWPVPLRRLARVRECCSRQGRVLRGTSLWFEDVVGHRATADSIEFL